MRCRAAPVPQCGDGVRRLLVVADPRQHAVQQGRARSAGIEPGAASPRPVPPSSLPRQRHLATYATPPLAARLTLVPALPGTDAGLFGAAALALADPGASPAAP
ncbi:hypothetical protein ACFYMW_31020 [Streptomyces sp. NPDC006692]|uniref:hypothetical protein n=1 Tax=unclassified Streptomyces TaxID=2593676 RepID=UPI00367A2D93